MQKQYRKKGEAESPEEEKHVPAEGEGHHREGRGGRGRGRGRGRGDHHHQEEGDHHERGDRPRGQFRPRGRGGEDGGHHGHGGHHRPPREKAPEGSWQWKYFNEERPHIERVTVTAETEIPEVKPKEERKKQPNKEDMVKKLDEIDKQAQHLNDKIRQISQQKKEIIEGGRAGDTNKTYRELLNEKIEEVKKLNKTKREYGDQLNEIDEGVKNLDE